MKLPAFPQFLARLVARLPHTPPSLVFCLTANQLLWPMLKQQDWSSLAGRRYAARVTDLGLALRFTVSARGFAPAAGIPDLTVSASAGDFLRLVLRREDPDTLFFSRRLVTEGDTELGLTVKNLLDALDPEAVLGVLPAPALRLARALVD
jgi:predicted lipid carrier protein YhbT